VISAGNPNRRRFIDKIAADARCGVLLGAVIGLVGGLVARFASGGICDPVQGPVFVCLGVGASGALLGWWIGCGARSQVHDELVHRMGSFEVPVCIGADPEHKLTAVQLLSEEGGTTIVSTAGSHTAGVAPSTPT
jgi:hypothetical protein